MGKYGWLPDKPDQRDYMLVRPSGISGLLQTIALPHHVDLRETGFDPPILDQGQLGSCTANALAAAFEFDLRKQGLTDFSPSRLFIYYNERAMEGTVPVDSGAAIRDGFKSIAQQGVCSENEWGYDIARFTTRPPEQAYTDALSNKAVMYRAVTQSIVALKSALASGYPVVFGFTVYESFESAQVAKTGTVPMPAPGEAVLGGHAVVAVGYCECKRFIVRNSWGTGWGQSGYFTMPFAYLGSASLSSDFWTVSTVS